MLEITHNASQKVTDCKEARPEILQRPAAIDTEAAGRRPYADLVYGLLAQASLVQPFSSQLIRAQARAGGSPAPHVHRAVGASGRTGPGW